MIETALRRPRRAIAAAALFVAAAAAWPGAAAAASTDKLAIGIVNFDEASFTSNSFAVALKQAAETRGWTVSIQDPRGDLPQANAICTQYVTRKVDAIVVNVYEISQMAQCMAYAARAKIPVFYMTTSLAKGMAGAVSTIVPGPINDELLKYAGGTKDLKVLALTYNPGAPCRTREKALDAALAKTPGLMQVDKHEINVPGQITSALAATQAWLNGHPESRKENLAIWACFSDPGFGALSAMKQAGRSGIPIYTWDIDKQTVDALKSKGFTATLWVDADGLAQQMIKQITDHAAGQPSREEEATSLVVTPANVDDVVTKHPDIDR